MRRAEDRWHLWDLRRWNPGGPGTEKNPAWWAEDIRTAVLVSATLSDFTGYPCPGLLPWDKGSRVKRRSQNEMYLGQIQEQVSRQLGDPSGAAFIARARQALAWTLSPAARGFEAATVDGAVQGARSAQVLLARLAPDVSARTLQRVAGVFETQLAEGNSMHEGGLGLTLRAAGEGRARREAWLLGAAADMTAAGTLGTEAAAAQDLGALIPTLRGAGDDSAFAERELIHATSEIRDVFWSLCELSRDGTLPLTGLEAILSSSGHLRIGARARPGKEEPELDDGQLKLIPGLPQVYAALAGYNDIRAATAAWLRAEACSEVGVSTEALDEKLSGQPPFHLTPENLALERCLSWPGGAWQVRLARHPLDLESDGQALSHCLGWGGYAHAVSEGTALIVRILDNGESPQGIAREPLAGLPVLTVELAPEAGGKAGWKIVQARGQGNRSVSAHEAALLGEWAAAVGVLGGDAQIPTRKELAGQRVQGLTVTALAHGKADDAQSAPIDDERIQLAVRAHARRLAELWTPEARRIHAEALGRVTQMRERAEARLKRELMRLHELGESALVGTFETGSILMGTHALELAPDTRPRLSDVTDPNFGVPALRIWQRSEIDVSDALEFTEGTDIVILRPPKNPGRPMRAEYGGTHRSLSDVPLSREVMGVLLNPDVVARALHRGESGTVLTLRSVLDLPLDGFEPLATKITGKKGVTLREQLVAFLSTG
ncbi:hypothetical protein [Deinococcus sp. AJ005]|uniref:hypothetical protein n=1 Tax=Deinococcus sp. AJ005 TaxID=2652443 RepID=UPI00125CCCAB|nr:hypothetical protein [Deinococcus sp. AJ005]QFP77010.1 hypothetical protein DAAJ005_11525 [Deinococcus sp. AJ005]